MFLRIDSQPIEIEGSVYEFISNPDSDTYDPTEEIRSPQGVEKAKEYFDKVARQPTFIAKEQVFLRVGDANRCLISPQASPALSPETSGSPAENDATNDSPSIAFGLPKDWVVYPIPKEQAKRKSSIRIEVTDEEAEPEEPKRKDSVTGCIDIDWEDPVNPVKFNAEPKTNETSSHANKPRRASEQGTSTSNLEPLHFSIIEDEVDPHPRSHPSFIDERNRDIPAPTTPGIKRRPELLSEKQTYDARREARHYIRVVTRNSLGLVATVALSTVAPQLLIAAAINAYCLTQGARHLYHHNQWLKAHGVSIKKRDITIAVAEGIVVKVAVLFLTVCHDDFLVFSHSWFKPAILPLLQAHDAVFGASSILGEPAEWFTKPADAVQEALGITTNAQRAAGALMGGWAEPTRELLENIFVVGSVQAGMELGVDAVEKHVGEARNAVHKSAQRVKDRLHPKQARNEEERRVMEAVGGTGKNSLSLRPPVERKRRWSDSIFSNRFLRRHKTGME